MFLVSLLIVILPLSLLTQERQLQRLSGYDLTKPAHRWVLPPKLHEISGITDIDSSTVACVQDENGVLFFLDLHAGRITRELFFWYNGDYEGVARAGNTLYVLRSDGVIYEIPNYTQGEPETRYYATNIPAPNNEGLCHDREGGRLLIGCKGKVDKGPGFGDKRHIYAFDLKTKSLLPRPAFEFDARELSHRAVLAGAIPATRTKKNGTVAPASIRLYTSEIAVHPVTNELYLLSAGDYLLLVFAMSGELRHIEPLDPVLFNKAEGISFLMNGDMLITNEGQQGRPTLLKFVYNRSEK